MNSNTLNRIGSTTTTQVVCAVVFCTFSLAWLCWFQADLLMVAQHVWSGGQTHYNRVVSPLAITFALLAIQQIVFRTTGLAKRTHALTYFPSMLLLAIISDINPQSSDYCISSRWWWITPLVLLTWGLVVWVSRLALPFDNSKVNTGFFSRRVWGNVLQMVMMMLMVAMLSITNDVAHYRSHVEVSIMNGELDEALRTGERSSGTDVHLTMLRAYALSLKGQLGERLFEYPIVGHSDDLLPMMKGRSRVVLLSRDSIYNYFGARPIGISTMNRYFDLLEKDSLATTAVADYRLCGCLIDGRLDDFAYYLPKYYDVNQPLPKHFREALILYNHLKYNPSLVYKDDVMDEDWNNFQELRDAYKSPNERKAVLAERYGGSYWYYYYYCAYRKK